MSVNKTKVLVECAMLVALGTVLSFVQIPVGPYGGSITAAATLPIIMISFRHGTKWGILSALLFAVIQMGLGLSNVLYCKTLLSQFACIFLDYILAYTCLGFACSIGSLTSNKKVSILFGAGVVGLIRYLCSFVSGILLWGAYAPEGMAVWHYSLFYNGSYMIPEIAITVGAAMLLQKFLYPTKTPAIV